MNDQQKKEQYSAVDGWPGLNPGISGEGAEPLIQNFGCPVLRCFGRAGLLSVSSSRNSNDACPDVLVPSPKPQLPKMSLHHPVK
jgi:L-2-hydroxyglutarate oxidase LhgO